MKVWGVTPEQVAQVVNHISNTSYGGNVIVDPGGLHACPKMVGRAYQFALRVKDSKARGARMSGRGRHTVAVSWHAHRDIMRALFAAGATRIKTAIEDYRGAEDFEGKFQGTWFHNVGSRMFPARLGDLSVL